MDITYVVNKDHTLYILSFLLGFPSCSNIYDCELPSQVIYKKVFLCYIRIPLNKLYNSAF